MWGVPFDYIIHNCTISDQSVFFPTIKIYLMTQLAPAFIHDSPHKWTSRVSRSQYSRPSSSTSSHSPRLWSGPTVRVRGRVQYSFPGERSIFSDGGKYEFHLARFTEDVFLSSSFIIQITHFNVNRLLMFLFGLEVSQDFECDVARRKEGRPAALQLQKIIM